LGIINFEISRRKKALGGVDPPRAFFIAVSFLGGIVSVFYVKHYTRSREDFAGKHGKIIKGLWLT
jgi:hypothetical protein